MNKLVASSLFFAGLSGTTQASTFDDAIKNASTSGQFRFGYISKTAKGNSTQTGAAVAGEIKFETDKWNRLQFAIAPYFVEKVDALSGNATSNTLNSDFFNSSNEGFAYLGEAYLNYAFNNGSVRLGRQKLDNPFINTDDIRLFSNTFNAAWLNMSLSKSLILEAGQVSSWAGFDSGSSQEKFKKASNDGVTAAGLNYKKSDAFSAQAWYYSFDKEYSLLYADVTYLYGGIELGAQVGSYTEATSTSTLNADGSVVGVSVKFASGPFSFAAVVNSGANAPGKSANLGLGGGNYYAAMDESTINGLNDVQARVFSFEYVANDKFTAGVALGHFENNDKSTKIDETNFVFDYSVSDKLNLSFIHTTVDDAGTANDFSRQTARATYLF